MKTKKLNKKLYLNKKTVASLNIDQLNNAKGGTYDWTEQLACTDLACPTCIVTCDCPNPTIGINCGATNPQSPCEPE